VSTFRIGHYNLPAQLASTGQGTTFIGGMEFGSNLVQQEIIKSLDELLSFLAEYRVGIVDIFDEQSINGTKILDLRIYECIECAELPNMGKALCFFEAGLITGVLSEITKKEVKTEEVRCWTSGYSFCQFEVKING
jgi:predicted hydrocarbon binding protein